MYIDDSRIIRVSSTGFGDASYYRNHQDYNSEKRKVEACWECARGERIQETYDHVVSTIPLPILINSISPTPPAEVISAASRLKALGVYVTSVHALDASHRNSFAITIPSPKVSFHRMTMIDLWKTIHA